MFSQLATHPPINCHLTSSGDYVPVPCLLQEEALELHRASALLLEDYEQLNPEANLVIQLEKSITHLRNL
jgi:hypothetical protein